MRFEMSGLNILCNNRFVLDTFYFPSRTSIYAYRIEISWHPLSAAYFSLCIGNRLQLAKRDIISQQIALILVASLVLL